jgi:hypothetical protein
VLSGAEFDEVLKHCQQRMLLVPGLSGWLPIGAASVSLPAVQ